MIKIDLCDSTSGRLRKDWKLIMQEQFDKSEFKRFLKTKHGIWKIRTFEPKPDGIFYVFAICDVCQMKALVKIESVMSKGTSCAFCKSSGKEQ
jgi:hypothetical protein